MTDEGSNRTGSRSQGQPGQVEETGRTVGEAVERALARLGLLGSQAEVQVVDEGSRGVLGLGSREARVVVRAKGGADRAAVVRSVAEKLIQLMGFPAETSVEDTPETIRVDVKGDDLGALIGKHGQTLASLEALVGLISGRRLGSMTRIEMDVLGYREGRRAALQALAQKTADRVARSGREIALVPMDARDRRIVHLALQDHPDVTTASRGEGELRRVVVTPRTAAKSIEEEQPAGSARADSPGQEPSADMTSQRRGIVGAQGWSDRSRSSKYHGRWTTRTLGRPQGRPYRTSKGSLRDGNRKTPRLSAGQPIQGRPEGLPVDEELEAEIQAHLDRSGRSGSPEPAATQPPEVPKRDEDDPPGPEEQG